MATRTDVRSLYRRQGYAQVPFQFILCPHLEKVFRQETGATVGYDEHFGFALRSRWHHALPRPTFDPARWFPGESFRPGTIFDEWGIGHEPGSDAAHHMTRLLHPLASATGLADLDAYSFPDWSDQPDPALVTEVRALHERGVAAEGPLHCTLWETAWYLRGMDRLVADFADDPDFAEALLDRITERSMRRAQAYARAGMDVICLGDDIGTQSRLMMGPGTYRTWLKPRMRRIVDAAKAIAPDIIIHYHSCGHVTGLIPDLIEAGVEVLNPVQPESMDIEDLHRRFGRDLSFNGTLGTQTLMPFGTPEQVRDETWRMLRLAGPQGGILPCPTHMLEPEVPWKNVMAYVEACRTWGG